VKKKIKIKIEIKIEIETLTEPQALLYNTFFWLGVFVDPLSCFFKDLALHAFSYLDICSLAKCAKVCKKWRVVACDDQLWRPLIQQLFPQIVSLKPKNMRFYDYFNSRAVATIDHVIDRIHNTFHQVKKDRRYAFDCYFPPNLSDCVFKLNFGYYQDEKIKRMDGVKVTKRKRIDARDFCLFMGKLSEDPNFCSTGKKCVRICNHHKFGIESHLYIIGKLTSRQSTVEFIHAIDLCKPIFVRGDEITLQVPEERVAKATAFCIIA
jgi:hypothetical protein